MISGIGGSEDDRGGTEGMQGDHHEERGFKAKTVRGRLNQAERICNCVIVSFWHRLSSSRSVKINKGF